MKYSGVHHLSEENSGVRAGALGPPVQRPDIIFVHSSAQGAFKGLSWRLLTQGKQNRACTTIVCLGGCSHWWNGLEYVLDHITLVQIHSVQICHTMGHKGVRIHLRTPSVFV